MKQDTTDLEQLKALALAATPGPWHVEQSRGDAGGQYTAICAEPAPFGDEVAGEYSTSPADAAYIAAVNPAVVLDLIARIEHLEAGVRHD